MSISTIIKTLSFSSIIIIVCIIYFYYLNRLFENDRSYQYLTEIEREMSMKSEQSLYYYYYKILINDENDFNYKNFIQTINQKIFNDRHSLAPSTVNSFKLLTILPEIFLATLYRLMRTILINGFKVDFDQDWRRCYLIENLENDDDDNNDEDYYDRNQILSTCEGIGEPFYFYVYSVFTLNSIVPVLIGLISYYLGNRSICSFIISIVMFALNQINTSRVQWTVPLRENFGYPLFLLHQFLLIRLITKQNDWKNLSINKKQSLYLTILILAQLLSWQFTSFLFLIQTLCLYLSFEFIPNFYTSANDRIGEKFLQKYFLIHIFAILIQSMIQLGNVNVLKSLYFLFISSYISSTLLLSLLSKSSMIMKKLKNYYQFYKFSSIVIMIIWNFYISEYILQYLMPHQFKNNDEDNMKHIWSILLSKFSRNYQTFHSLLYTCSKEYDWIHLNELYQLLFTKSMIGYISIIGILLRFYHNFFKFTTKSLLSIKFQLKSLPPTSLLSLSLFLNHCLITICFTLMAIMIMRLKLLMMPQLIISCGLIFTIYNQDNYNNSKNIVDANDSNRMKKFKHRSNDNNNKNYNKNNNWFDWLLLTIIISILIGTKSYTSIYRYLNQQPQQFSNESLEQILMIIKQNLSTDNGDILGGSMSTMATVLLATDRKIAINPFYESTIIRNRTYQIYQIYSQRSPKIIHNDLCELKLNYLLIETVYCYGNIGHSCTMLNIWNTEDKRIGFDDHNTNNPEDRLCHRLISNNVDQLHNNNQTNIIMDGITKNYQLIASNDLYYLYKILNCNNR